MRGVLTLKNTIKDTALATRHHASPILRLKTETSPMQLLTLLRKRSRMGATRPRWTPSGLIMTCGEGGGRAQCHGRAPDRFMKPGRSQAPSSYVGGLRVDEKTEGREKSIRMDGRRSKGPTRCTRSLRGVGKTPPMHHLTSILDVCVSSYDLE